MKDPRWVEGFHSGTYSNKIFVYFLCWPKKNRSQSYQLPSIMVSVVLYNISQYTLKHEHLTTLSRALPHSKKMITSPANSCIMICKPSPLPYCLASGNMNSPHFKCPPPPILTPENDPHRRGNNSTRLPSTWILYSHGANCFFYCFVAQWFFTRMLIWHFNKLCEWLQCCGGIAPIRLTADPLAGPLCL